MANLGDDAATRTAKVLSLPTRAAILSLLLRSGAKTVKEIADHFQIHPNVARAHLDLMVEAGFLATETRRRAKVRPLERMLADATGQLDRIRELIERTRNVSGTPGT